MDLIRINNYYKEIEQIKRFAHTENESALRFAFHKLLSKYAKERNYQFVPEIKLVQSRKTPDGTIFTSTNEVVGYTESKDSKDDFETEINKKLQLGYPSFNLLFEDSETIILFQEGNRFQENMQNPENLHKILLQFISYQSKEIIEYQNAIEFFKNELPEVLTDIKSLLNQQLEINNELKENRNNLFILCKKSINKKIRIEDIDEMLLQHIFTNEIFSSIYQRDKYHSNNNIAKTIDDVVKTFFTEEEELKFKSKTDKYYNVIKSKASKLSNINDKQKFIKEVYEQFYKIYNPKLADKLGIVFTPNEVVDFMIKSTDFLLAKYFKKQLKDKNVEIIDPATGTGTFICSLLNYLPEKDLEYKYLNEINANEISILPYYVANLNIEETYRQIKKDFKYFKNLVFVDTLELVNHAQSKNGGHSQDLYDFTLENLERIKNQNKKQISVVIGNPPYNANQISENDNNKNKTYFREDGNGVDDAIKKTYIKFSLAQKTKVYDMYARFFRWASDRIENEGIISFITNSSFIDSKTFDGFRKSILKEFQYVYIVDLGGYINKGDTSGNIFNIKTGVCISFMIKKKKTNTDECQIFYTKPQIEGAANKLQYLGIDFDDIEFERIFPDEKNNWINKSNSDFYDLIPLINSETKAGKNENAIFKIYANGVATNRDEWVYDIDKNTLKNKIEFFIETYNNQVDKYVATLKKHPKTREFSRFYTDKIKWSRDLKNKFLRSKKIIFNNLLLKESFVSPFLTKYFYSEKILNDVLTEFHYKFFKNDLSASNTIITFGQLIKTHKFQVLAVDKIFNKNIIDSINCSQGVGLYYYETQKSEKGKTEIIRKDNITDWALNKFQNDYNNKDITKENIFHYVYAILHNPNYNEKYENDLKKEFPRMPYYSDFYKWVEYGRKLMNLHLNYENVEEYNLEVINISTKNKNIKPKLKIDKSKKNIIIDEETQIINIPNECNQYYLGNKTAIEWILNHYKEFQYSEKTEYGTILNKQFNNYKFSDYKDSVVSLIKKICTVSVETMHIINEMKKESE